MSDHADQSPSEWVMRFAPLAERGASVLDVACGSGRHTRLFVERGCHVTAIDRAPRLDPVLASHACVEAVTADLEQDGWPLGDRRFDVIVVTQYLHRPLFPDLRAALSPEGLLLYETFAVGNAAFGKPSNPDFLLKPRELLETLAADLRVIAFEDGLIETPRRALVQRLAARRAAVDGLLEPRKVALRPS